MQDQEPNTSSSKDESQAEVDQIFNEFQQLQWMKYGKIMPEKWIDPFECED